MPPVIPPTLSTLVSSCRSSSATWNRPFGVQCAARFAVHAHDLLLVRDDAGLDARVPRRIFHQPAAADVLLGQQGQQLHRRVVLADGPEQFRRGFQRHEVAGHVGRAAGHETFAGEIHHRHRRFRRDARDAAPDELVEHHVADDEHAGLLRGG